MSCLLCVKRAGSYFCPNSGDLGREHAGSSTARAGKEEEEAGSGMCDEVWTPRRGAIKRCSASERLSEPQPQAGENPRGREGGEEGDHSSLTVRAGQGQEGRASGEIQMAGKSELEVGMPGTGDKYEPRTQVQPPGAQCTSEGVCSGLVPASLAL